MITQTFIYQCTEFFIINYANITSVDMAMMIVNKFIQIIMAIAYKVTKIRIFDCLSVINYGRSDSFSVYEKAIPGVEYIFTLAGNSEISIGSLIIRGRLTMSTSLLM